MDSHLLPPSRFQNFHNGEVTMHGWTRLLSHRLMGSYEATEAGEKNGPVIICES
jgi:hypothetical protein